MTVLEDGTEVAPHDEPPEGWQGDPVDYWRGRAHLFGSEVHRLTLLVDEAVVLLHEAGRHAEADAIDSQANPW